MCKFACGIAITLLICIPPAPWIYLHLFVLALECSLFLWLLSTWHYEIPLNVFFKELIHMGVLAVQNILKERRMLLHARSASWIVLQWFCYDDDVTWLYLDEVVITFSTRDPMSFNRIELDWIENPWCSQSKHVARKLWSAFCVPHSECDEIKMFSF